MLAPNRARAEQIPIEDADEIRGEWVDLAERANDPNPYYEIDHLVAICRYMLPKEDHQLVLVRHPRSKRLEGLFPITVKGLRHGYPGGVTHISFDSLIGQSVPLIAGDDPASTWTAFLEFVAEQPDLPDVVHLTEFYPESACGEALATAAEQGRAVYRAESAFERAIAANELTYDDYVGRWSRNSTRNINGGFKKLSELGTIELSMLEPEESGFETALREFLELERAGWKGREGTALASRQNTRDFAFAAYGARQAAPRIHLAVMRLDGTLIAGAISLVAQRRAYFIKSAYDEGYSQHSPGVLLTAYLLEEMLKNGRYVRLDSSSDAGHPVGRIWLERERVERAFVAAADRTNEHAIDHLISRRATLKRVRDNARGIARRLRLAA